MPDSSHTSLQVVVHGNNEITVKDERGLPNTCIDCRFSGWLTQYEFNGYKRPRTCLFYSGGADPEDGDRVWDDSVYSEWGHRDSANKWRKRYPLCHFKNADGKCSDFVRAKPTPWYKRIFFRRFFRRQMRR